MRHSSLAACALSLSISVVACGDGGNSDFDANPNPDSAGTTPHSLVVAREGALVAFDVATGAERPGTLTNVTGPSEMQALDPGYAMVNVTGRNEILIVNLYDMLEVGRVPSSATTGTRPVHTFISPEYSGKRYWLSLNDGDGTAPTNTARVLDLTPGSATYLQPVGEVPLGIGHHKAAFSKTQPRVVISNIGDCDNVMSVYDFSNPAAITTLATMDSTDAAFGGPGQPMCDPTYQNGFPPSPHGCATSPLSGKVYCSLTGQGQEVVVDIDAATPTFTLIDTNGAGGGYSFAHPDGRYVYTLQETPREGDPGPAIPCVVGQVVVVDTMTDTIALQLALKYTGPACTTALAGTAAETANPGHGYFSHDGDTLFIAMSGGFGVDTARVDQVVVLDTSDPAAPTQLASIPVGMGTSHGTGTIDGPGQRLYIVNKVDGTVSDIDVATRTVTRTIDVGDAPAVVTTYGTAEGPGHQTGPVE